MVSSNFSLCSFYFFLKMSFNGWLVSIRIQTRSIHCIWLIILFISNSLPHPALSISVFSEWLNYLIRISHILVLADWLLLLFNTLLYLQISSKLVVRSLDSCLVFSPRQEHTVGALLAFCDSSQQTRCLVVLLLLSLMIDQWVT